MSATEIKRALELRDELYRYVAHLPSLSAGGAGAEAAAAAAASVQDINAIVRLRQHAASDAAGA